MQIKIMVAAHKNFEMPQNYNLYLPILVGAVKNNRPEIAYQRDDEGQNISERNPNYNELTAIYWAWKNLDADVIGLAHYRRLLSKTTKRNIDSVLDEDQILELLAKAPIILPKKRNYYIESNYSHYVHAHHEEPLKVTRNVVEKLYPDYLDSFDKVMQTRSAHMFNMFIMKKEYFDEYASWLFDILFDVEKNIDISDYNVQEARVFGYLSELLMDVWINKNNYDYVETNWIQLGERNLPKKAYHFLRRKFVKSNGKAQTHF